VFLDDSIILLQNDVGIFVYRMTSCQTDVGLDVSCTIRMVIRVCFEETLIKTLSILHLASLI